MGAVEFLLSTDINELPSPGFETGLLQPQRNVLTTRRSNILSTWRSGPAFLGCVLKTLNFVFHF